MVYNVRLTRVKNGAALRTDEIDGHTDDLPAVGKRFVIFGPPLDPTKGLRMVTTSLVKSVESLDHDVIQFETENSTYRLDILE